MSADYCDVSKAVRPPRVGTPTWARGMKLKGTTPQTKIAGGTAMMAGGTAGVIAVNRNEKKKQAVGKAFTGASAARGLSAVKRTGDKALNFAAGAPKATRGKATTPGGTRAPFASVNRPGGAIFKPSRSTVGAGPAGSTVASSTGMKLTRPAKVGAMATGGAGLAGGAYGLNQKKNQIGKSDPFGIEKSFSSGFVRGLRGKNTPVTPKRGVPRTRETIKTSRKESLFLKPSTASVRTRTVSSGDDVRTTIERTREGGGLRRGVKVGALTGAGGAGVGVGLDFADKKNTAKKISEKFGKREFGTTKRDAVRRHATVGGAAGAVFGPVGAAAGGGVTGAALARDGHKAKVGTRAAGRAALTSAGGGLGGAMAGRVLGGSSGAALGAIGGSLYGGGHGARRATQNAFDRGELKASPRKKKSVKKSDAISAFGIEH